MSSITQVVVVDRSTSVPRSASRAHARPPIDDSLGQVIIVFQKTLTDLKATVEEVQKENTSLRERLITAEAHSAEKEIASAAALAAQGATISEQATTIAGLTATVSALTGMIAKLQTDIEPLIAKHYAPPPPPTKLVPYMTDGNPTGGFFTQTYINGEWR